MILPILTIPLDEKRLRMVSRVLSEEEVKSKNIQSFIDNLLETASAARTTEGWISAGLAAIQVGNPIKLFVVRDFRNNGWNVYINPVIERLGEAIDTRAESCLSIPGVIADVSRHKRIRITYLDRRGNPHTEKTDGFQARIIQHEFDHLNGILFTDVAVSS